MTNTALPRVPLAGSITACTYDGIIESAHVTPGCLLFWQCNMLFSPATCVPWPVTLALTRFRFDAPCAGLLPALLKVADLDLSICSWLFIPSISRWL